MKVAAWRGHGGLAAAVAHHLGVSGGGVVLGTGARRARLYLYGVVLAFALFATFLAFTPWLPAPFQSLPSVMWFDGFLASASPYRVQVSGFFSSLFPANSSSSSQVISDGVVPRRSGGDFMASVAEAGTNGSSAGRPDKRSGGGGVVPGGIGSGGVRSDISASGNATTSMMQSNAPPDVRVVGGGGASSNSTWIAGAASSNSTGILRQDNTTSYLTAGPPVGKLIKPSKSCNQCSLSSTYP